MAGNKCGGMGGMKAPGKVDPKAGKPGSPVPPGNSTPPPKGKKRKAGEIGAYLKKKKKGATEPDADTSGDDI